MSSRPNDLTHDILIGILNLNPSKSFSSKGEVVVVVRAWTYRPSDFRKALVYLDIGGEIYIEEFAIQSHSSEPYIRAWKRTGHNPQDMLVVFFLSFEDNLSQLIEIYDYDSSCTYEPS